MGRKHECTRTAPLLWDYAEQRLEAAKRERIAAHLLACAECRAQAEAYRQTAQMLDSYRSQLLPAQENAWPALRQQLAAESSSRSVARRTFLPVLVWGGAALACALLALFTLRIGLLPQRGTPTQADSSPSLLPLPDPLGAMSSSPKATGLSLEGLHAATTNKRGTVTTFQLQAEIANARPNRDTAASKTAATPFAAMRPVRSRLAQAKAPAPLVVWKEETVRRYSASVIRPVVLARLDAEKGIVGLTPVALETPMPPVEMLPKAAEPDAGEATHSTQENY